MEKYYLYGQLFACLEFIDQAEQVMWFESLQNPLAMVDWNTNRMSSLLRNHRRKLNAMNANSARIIELELVNVFRQLPVEPFPLLQTDEQRHDFYEGYSSQLQKLMMELRPTRKDEVV